MRMQIRDRVAIGLGIAFGVGVLLALGYALSQFGAARWWAGGIGVVMAFLYAVLAVGYLGRGTGTVVVDAETIHQPGPMGWSVRLAEVETARLADARGRSVLLVQLSPAALTASGVRRQLQWGRWMVRTPGADDRTLQIPVARSSVTAATGWVADRAH